MVPKKDLALTWRDFVFLVRPCLVAGSAEIGNPKGTRDWCDAA